MSLSSTTLTIQSHDGPLLVTFEPALSVERYAMICDLVQHRQLSRTQMRSMLESVALSWRSKCKCEMPELFVEA
jgi:hypothetical protein